MSFSWGTKLTLIFVLFASLISYMVYRCVNIPVNLVTSEYYKDEIAYQNVIDETKNANALSSQVQLHKDVSAITIILPGEMKNAKVSGTVLFYCTANAANDKQFKIQTASAAQILNGKLMPGAYVVKTTWTAGNTSYYNEQPLTIF